MSAESSIALDRLNDAQRRAACFGGADAAGRFHSGPLLVIAGAGTGKTATLAHRVAYLVMQGVDPMRILLLTFSRRAAQEMTRRAERLLVQALSAGAGGRPPPAVRLPWAGTFHSIGARLLRQFAPRIGLDASFGILDRGDAADLIDVIRHERGLSAKARRFPRKDTCLAIYSHRVNTGWPLERVLREMFPWCVDCADDLRGLFRDYVARKQANGVLDYDDLLLWWQIAMNDAALARDIGARFDHVLVDEFQDTNALQAGILAALKPRGDGVTVVGDDAQSIYSFRAADVGNILDFPRRFDPPAACITLEQNYRSVQPVLDASNALIAEADRGHRKTLRAQRGDGARPQLVTVADEREQSNWVADRILRHREAGVPLKRQAVLFRSGHHSDALEVELARRNIPFVKHGGLRFLEAAHIKDLLSVLRWAENPRNGIAAFRALQLMSGFGPANARRCLDHLAAQAQAQAQAQGPGGAGGSAPVRPVPAASGSLLTPGLLLAGLAGFTPPTAAREQWRGFVELMTALLDPAARWPAQLTALRAWYQPLLEQRHDDAFVRAADLDMLQAVAGEFTSRERFLTELTLDPPQASGDLADDALQDEDYLILSTVHSAKGQEWDAVYVLNVTDGNFPNEYATARRESVDEERRLLYVAMTRSRDALYLLEPQRWYVTQQPRYGPTYVHAARSRFLSAKVLACFDRVAPDSDERPLPGAPSGALLRQPEPAQADLAVPAIDVAGRLRDMW